MLEAYILTALGSLGYYLARQGSAAATVASVPQQKTDQRQPAAPDVYSSRRVEEVRAAEAAAATAAWREQQNREEAAHRASASANASMPVVLPPRPAGTVHSQLCGMDLPVSEFTHNNMTHFYSGSLRQPVDFSRSLPVLEHFTGIASDTPEPPRKREQAPMFAMSRDLGNPFGMQSPVEFEQMRMEPSRIQNNVLPFQQIRDAPPTPALETRQLPKNVNDLRAANKPKLTFEGRMIESGLRGTLRGDAPVPVKNRPETFAYLGNERMAPSSAAYTKPSERPEMSVTDRATSRAETGHRAGGRGGAPGAAASRGAAPALLDPTSYIAPTRQATKAPAPAGATAAGRIGLGLADDHGRGSITVYENNRAVTQTRTYQGSLTTAVKAIVAPIVDIIAPTKKDSLAAAPRQFGSLQAPANMPAKMPVGPVDVLRTTLKEAVLTPAPTANIKVVRAAGVARDPNDTARATTKETTLTPTPAANLRGPVRVSVYDPSDVARTTMKQATLAPSVSANLVSSRVAGPAYDPDHMARETIKHATLTPAEPVNMASTRAAGPAYDPAATARTTLKQTTMAPAQPANAAPGRTAGPAYDPAAVARETLKHSTLSPAKPANMASARAAGPAYDPNAVARETLKHAMLAPSQPANMASSRAAGPTYDPNAIARTTAKELLHSESQGGFLSTGAVAGPATNPDDAARTTLRQTMRSPNTTTNMRVARAVGTMHDPDQVARTTLKEVSLRKVGVAHAAGGAGGVLQGTRGGYVETNVNAKDTSRQEYVDNERYGGVEGSNGDGYMVANPDVRDTVRQDTCDNDYYGGTGADVKAPRSYEDMYAAIINDLREGTLAGREPTNSGPKQFVGKEDMEGSVRVNKRNVDVTYDMTEMWSADVPIAEGVDRDDRVRLLGRSTRYEEEEEENGDSKRSNTNTRSTEAVAVARQLSANPYALRGPALAQAQAVANEDDDFFEGYD